MESQTPNKVGTKQLIVYKLSDKRHKIILIIFKYRAYSTKTLDAISLSGHYESSLRKQNASRQKPELLFTKF